jgi:hypothetical protein
MESHECKAKQIDGRSAHLMDILEQKVNMSKKRLLVDQPLLESSMFSDRYMGMRLLCYSRPRSTLTTICG